jgi:hypothetical protein
VFAGSGIRWWAGGVDDSISGVELSGLLYAEVVAPLLGRYFPGLRHAAGRLGSGSDVLGLDDVTSRDHDWGCRLTLLVDECDRVAVPRVGRMLEEQLPQRYRGFPVRFPVTWRSAEAHNVEVGTVAEFAVGRLGVDPSGGLSAVEWLLLTGQSVLEVVAGPVFADRTDGLAPIREVLQWYPRDVELAVLAAGWRRISQRLPMVGRVAERGDEIGSRLLCAELAGDVISLAFVLSRRWSPYAKWRGTVFRMLSVAADLDGLLETATAAERWQVREAALVDACEVLLGAQRARGLPSPGSAVVPFWDRPYRTVSEDVRAFLLGDVRDPDVAALLPGSGSIEQRVDSVDVLAAPERRRDLQAVYRNWIAAHRAG